MRHATPRFFPRLAFVDTTALNKAAGAAICQIIRPEYYLAHANAAFLDRTGG